MAGIVPLSCLGNGHSQKVLLKCLMCMLQYDQDMLSRVERAAASNCVLRYVGQVDVAQKSCSVALQVLLGPVCLHESLACTV